MRCAMKRGGTDLHEHLATVFVVAGIEELLDKFSVCGRSVSLLTETHVLKGREGKERKMNGADEEKSVISGKGVGVLSVTREREGEGEMWWGHCEQSVFLYHVMLPSGILCTPYCSCQHRCVLAGIFKLRVT